MKKKKDEVTIRSSAAEYLTYVASVGDQQDSVEMRYEDENIWLTQKMMTTLYDVDVRTINEHIKKIYLDSELDEDTTIRKFRIVQTEGSRQVARDIKHYNLQMIIAVGFKVNSERAVQFRKWVNQIAKDYTIKGWVMDDERLKRGTYLTEKYFDEQLERIRETFGKTGSDGKNHWWMPGSYAEVIYQLLEKEENITLMCAAPVVGVKLKTSGNRNQVTGVRIMRNGDYQDIDAAVTIDATGNGLIADMAGCEYMFGSEAKSDYNEPVGIEVADGKVQPCTWMLISERIKRNAILPIDKLKGSSAVEDNLNRWVKADDKEDMIRRDAGIYLHWGRTVYCKDTREPLLLAQAQQEALERLQENLEIWHEAGYAVHLAPKLGVREVRRIKGEYVLTANDLIAGTMHDDVIAHAHYSFDVWGMKIPEEMKHIGPYGIPYRSILPTKTEGLLTAGRIISATRIAHSSLRVQPICSNIGMAAGTAAAMSALNQTGLRSIDIKQLQDRLASMGLFDGLKKK